MRGIYKYGICFIILLIFLLTSALFAGLSVSPKRLFLDPSLRSAPLTVYNNGSEEKEVWLEIKYGYIQSDDSGKSKVVISDSLTGDSRSAAQWIKAYPQRFILPGGESQIVRFVAYPPPNLQDGEYWARVTVTEKARKEVRKAGQKALKPSAGIRFMTSIGIPVYYRYGKVSTDLKISDLNVTLSGDEITANMSLQNIGNAAYLGSKSVRLVNNTGKVVYSLKSDIFVFNTLLNIERIKRGALPSGQYSLEIEITGRKQTSKGNIVVDYRPVRTVASIQIP